MKGLGHRAVAVSVALGVPQALDAIGWAHIAPEQAVAAAVLAVPFSAGPLSPDADLPGSWLARFGHRHGVHGWWWPALAAWGLLSSPAAAIYAAWGPIIGWTSHLFPADFIFGKQGRSIPKGIPLIPFCGRRKWNRIGLGLRVTGRDGDGHSILEASATALVILGLIPWQLWTMLGAIPGLA